MALSSQVVSQEDIDAGVDWIRQMYRDADVLRDVDAVSRRVAGEATLSLGNSPPLRGRVSLEKLFKWKYGGCNSIEHKIQDVWVLSDRIVVTLIAKYTLKDDSKSSVNCVAIWHKKPADDKASKVEIYGDFHEVLDRLKVIQGLPGL